MTQPLLLSLMMLSQGSSSAVDYIIDFCMAAAASDWNEPTLVDAFYHKPSDRLKDALTAYDRPRRLRPLMDLVTCLDVSGKRTRLSAKEGGAAEPYCDRYNPLSSNCSGSSFC